MKSNNMAKIAQLMMNRNNMDLQSETFLPDESEFTRIGGGNDDDNWDDLFSGLNKFEETIIDPDIENAFEKQMQLEIEKEFKFDTVERRKTIQKKKKPKLKNFTSNEPKPEEKKTNPEKPKPEEAQKTPVKEEIQTNEKPIPIQKPLPPPQPVTIQKAKTTIEQVNPVPKVEEKEEIPEDKKQDELKPYDNFYYCLACREVPPLSISKNTAIKIGGCKCKGETQENMLLSNFIKEIEKKHEVLKCEIENKHPKYTPANAFCIECNMNYCSQCRIDHDNFHPDHPVVDTTEVNLNTRCENTLCKTKDKIEYYCKTCKTHICNKCKLEHKKKHQIIKLNEMIDDTRLAKLKMSIRTAVKNMSLLIIDSMEIELEQFI